MNWDSHNYVTLAIDDDGYLHLSGNMHCRPLVYFRTTKPLDITTFEAGGHGRSAAKTRSPTLTSFRRCAVPAANYCLRTGTDAAGSGDQLYNLYD